MAEGEKRRTGVNFGSGSGGVLPEPAKVQEILRHFLVFDEQLKLFEKAKEELRGEFDTAAGFQAHLEKSIFFLHISSNDHGIYWDSFYSIVYNNMSAAYNKFLVPEFLKRVQRLYDLGARKIVINNVSPLGCQPFQRNKFSEHRGDCYEMTNSRIAMYNYMIALEIPKLQLSMQGSKIILVDLNKIFMDAIFVPASFGFNNVKDPCCVDDGTGSCKKDSVACKDRKEHLFFDAFHPSEAMHFVWTRRMLKDPSISHPCTLLGLIEAP